MSLLARTLYLADAVLQAWTTVTEANAWAGVEPAAWTAVSTKMGAPDMDAPVLIAAIPPFLIIEAVQGWIVDTTPSSMEKVRVCLMLNALRLKFFMEPVDLLPAPVIAGAPIMVGVAVVNPVMPTPGLLVKVKLSQVLDQRMDQ